MLGIKSLLQRPFCLYFAFTTTLRAAALGSRRTLCLWNARLLRVSADWEWGAALMSAWGKTQLLFVESIKCLMRSRGCNVVLQLFSDVAAFLATIRFQLKRNSAPPPPFFPSSIRTELLNLQTRRELMVLRSEMAVSEHLAPYERQRLTRPTFGRWTAAMSLLELHSERPHQTL